MEIREKIVAIREKLQAETPSAIMLTLNSKLSIEDAKVVNLYSNWKKF